MDKLVPVFAESLTPQSGTTYPEPFKSRMGRPTPRLTAPNPAHPEQISKIARTGTSRVASRLNKLELQLTRLDAAIDVSDMDVPGWRLHPLKGTMKGLHAVDVSGNWRLTFEFKHGHAYIVNRARRTPRYLQSLTERQDGHNP